MLHGLSENIAGFLLCRQCFEKDELDIYIYGVELIIASAIGTFLILAISVCMSVLPEGLLFLVPFSLLRSFTGGYHCYTYLKCNTLFVGTFLLCLLAYWLIAPYWQAVAAVTALSILWSAYVVFRYSPIEHKNKPLDAGQKKTCKKKAVVIYAIISFIAVSLLICHIWQAFMLPLVLDLVSAAMIGEIYSQRRRKNYEKSKFS